MSRVPSNRSRDQSRGRFRALASDKDASLVTATEDDHAIGEMLHDLQEQLGNQNRGLLAGARTFLPDVIAERIWSNTLRDDLIVSKTQGAVVFSDASGFTALTERLAQSANGAELLSKCLNKFFTPLIDTLTAYRGDVVKFSGDALTILFEAAGDDREGRGCRSACGSPTCGEHAPLELACLRASACCVEIHKRLHNFDTGEGGVRLTLHIGVGAGCVTILQVGGDQGRYEYVLAGQPLEQIAIAEPLAGSGETVLSPQCWNLVWDSMIEGPRIDSNPDFHRVLGLDTTRHTYPTIKQAARQSTSEVVLSDEISVADDELDRRIRMATRFIPRSVFKQLCTGSLRGMDEMRTVSIIFVQIGGVDVSTDTGAQRAAKLMSGMQATVYSQEGSLNKFLVDDKGLLFLFVFGLPPLVHIDDPTRATRACLDMTQFLVKMGLTGRIGITTGRVYCGVVGSDTRREYTCMGDTVNLSARLMANAEANTVLIDESTYRRCQNDFSFLRFAPIKVKGKEHSITTYRPLSPNATAEAAQPGAAAAASLGASGAAAVASAAAAAALPRVEARLEKADNCRCVLRATLKASPVSVRVPLPWTPKSVDFGGTSMLSSLRTWHSLQQAKEASRTLSERGGGTMILHGASGCGKDEICEEIIKHCIDEEGMVPLFGTMRMQTGDEYAAVFDVVASLLMMLYGRGDSREISVEKMTAAELLGYAKEANLSSRETQVLQDIWPSSRTGGLYAVGKQQLTMGLDPEATRCAAALARRLLAQLLEQESVVLTLRAWRGTQLSDYDTSAFWYLAQEMAVLSMSKRPHRLLVIVLSRTEVGRLQETSAPAASSDALEPTRNSAARVRYRLPTRLRRQGSADPPLGGEDGMGFMSAEQMPIGPLNEEEAHIYIGLLLGVGRPDRPSDKVPERLRKWLGSITLNNPRNIEEVIRQLREDGKLVVDGDRAIVAADLESVDIADWVHAGMVGNIISQVEIMNAEAQRIIKMAAVFDGPISALDIAAANRMYRPTSDLLAFHDSVQLLRSCEWLVGVNFLARYECAADSAPEDGQTWRLPRWIIPSLLTRKVVGATMLQSQKLQIKRAVLMQRALNIHLPIRMKAKRRMREELFGEVDTAEVRTRRRRQAAAAGAVARTKVVSTWRTTADSALEGLPSTCSVFPSGDGIDSVATSEHARLRDWLALMSLAGDADRVGQLLKKGACASGDQDGNPGPLHCACVAGDLDVLKLLLQARGDAEATVRQHGNCLDVAAAYGHFSVVKYLADEVGVVPSLQLSQSQEVAVPRISTTTDGARATVSEENDDSATPAVLVPVLSSAENSGWQAVEEINYRRSQTLLFLQDYVSLIDEERELDQDKRPAQRISGVAASRETHSVQARVMARLRDLNNSSLRGYVVSLCIALAIAGPDLWTLFSGSQQSLDVLLCLSMGVLCFDIVVRAVCDVSYLMSLGMGRDVIGALALAFEISWLLGVDRDEDFMRPDTPLDGRGGSYNVPLARLAPAADLLVRAGRYSGGAAHLINTLFVCCLGRSSLGDGNFGGIERLRKQLLHIITMHVATYTVLLVVMMPCLNFIVVPNQDMSMRAWTEILTAAMPAGNASTPHAVQSLDAFESFYSSLFYGPFKVCSGKRISASDFECNAGGTLWGSEVMQPREAASRLDIHSSVLELSFDFTQARRTKAWMNLAMLLTAITMMMLTTLFISRSISDLVLRPLQRMLSSAKEVAKPIFGDSSAFGNELMDEDLDDENDDEVLVLEKIVQKLGKIAGIAADIVNTEGESLEGLVGEDRAVMQMITQKQENQKDEAKPVLSQSENKPYHYDIDPNPGKMMQRRLGQIGISWSELDSWEFDILSFGQQKLIGLAGWILLLNTATFGECTLEAEATGIFLQTLCANYRAGNAFHNWYHAVDVQHTMWRMMRISQAHVFLTGLNQLAMLVAAIGHDVGHFGVNNAFLVETGHEITVRYNDCSPLENMHCAKLFEIITSTPGANIFKTVSRSDFFEIRRFCVEMVLHTDMAHHFEMVKEMQMLYQMNSDATSDELIRLFRERDTKTKVMNLILHSADISNPCKPWKITHDWALRCLDEFFDQGDKERQLGIPVQMLNDRTKVCKPFSQIGFGEFMIAPLEAAKTALFPSLSESTTFLEYNLWQWSRLWAEEKNPPEEEREKVAGRIQRVAQLFAEARQAGEVFFGNKKSSEGDEPGQI